MRASSRLSGLSDKSRRLYSKTYIVEPFSIVGFIAIYREACEVHGIFKVILIEQDFAGLKGNLTTMVHQITQGRFIKETD